MYDSVEDKGDQVRNETKRRRCVGELRDGFSENEGEKNALDAKWLV